jgi:hydrogenase maturation protease
MPEVAVIGCGNPLRGDDGLAWQAARQLARRFGAEAETRFLEESRFLSADGTVEILACQQLTLDLLDTVHQAGRVIFVDASVKGEPGALACETVSPEAPQNLISHQFDPPTLLAAVKALYGACPEAVLFSITAQSLDYVEQLSPPVEAALPELVRRVGELVEAQRGSA